MALALEIPFILGDLATIIGIANQGATAGEMAVLADTCNQILGHVLVIQDQNDRELAILSSVADQIGATYQLAGATFANTNGLTQYPNSPQAAVNLPPSPPESFVVSVGAGAADSVWATPIGTDLVPASNLLEDIGEFSGNYSLNTMQVSLSCPYFWMVTNWALEGPELPFPTGPVCFEEDVLPSDSRLSFLQRVQPGFAWENDHLGTGHVGATVTWGAQPIDYWLSWTRTEFEAIKVYNAGLAGPNVPAPVWPGAANAVLGTPVALSEEFTVAGPMNGVLVDITVNPVGRGKYDYNGHLSFMNIGALAFQNDAGYIEHPLALGFTTAIYTPRTMGTAAFCLIRTAPGLTGTITPWTISPQSE